MLAHIKNIGDILPYASKRNADKTALVFREKEFTFQQLDEMSNRLANALDNLGVKPGDRVSLYSINCWQWMVSYYAAGKLGAVVNPINVMLTPDEVRFVAEDCGSKVIILSKDKAEATRDAVSDVPGLSHIICYEQGADGILAFEDLLKTGSSEPKRSDRGPDDISTICYTSGTTGHPKGAALSHRAVLLNTFMTANMHVKTRNDCTVTALPSAHVYGNVVMNGMMFLGGKLVLMERFDEKETLSAIEKHRATMFEGVPTMYLFLLNYPDLEKYDLSSLTRCTVGGQTMSVDKMKEVESRFGCPLIELWGMTEIAGLGTTFPCYGVNKHGSIGISLPYAESKIASYENSKQTMPPGEPGELLIRGPIVMEKYWGKEEATKETVEPDGWLHTGDVGYMDEDGCVFIIDRKKDMILTAGFNVYPAEIERVLLKHPAVAMAAVGKVPDELKGELAHAFIVLKNNADATKKEVEEFCREHLAAYKVPRGIHFVEALPQTSTGKSMGRELGKLLND
jgi:long-chain acyl-CoA synthetase